MVSMVIPQREAKETAREYVSRVLKRNILDCTIKPGEVLSENYLAEQLQVSRAPIREAIAELEHVKLLEVRPQRGLYVTRLDFDFLRNSVIMRRAFELEMLMQYCAGEEEADLREMEINVSLQRVHYEYGDYSMVWQLDGRFHELLMIACGFSNMVEYVNDIKLINDRTRYLALNFSENLEIIEEHQALYEALKAKDAEKCREIMLHHVSIERENEKYAAIKEAHPDYCM